MIIDEEYEVTGADKLFGMSGEDSEFGFIRDYLKAPGGEPEGDVVD